MDAFPRPSPASYDFEQSLRRRGASPRTPTSARRPSDRAGDGYGQGATNGASRLLRPDSSRFATDHIIDNLVGDGTGRRGSPRGRSPRAQWRMDPGDFTLAEGEEEKVSPRGGANPYATMSPAARGRSGRDMYPYHDPSPRAASPRAPSPRREPVARAPSPRPSPRAYEPPPTMPSYSYGGMMQPMGPAMMPMPPMAMQSYEPYPMMAPTGYPGMPVPGMPSPAPGYVMDLAPGPLGTPFQRELREFAIAMHRIVAHLASVACCVMCVCVCV